MIATPAKKADRLVIILVIALAVLFLASMVHGLSSVPTVPIPQSEAESAAPTHGYSRTAPAFKYLQTEHDVIVLLGKPDSTQAFSGDGSQLWYYHNVSYDPVTDKTDAVVQFRIDKGGHVTATNFY